MKTWQPAGKGKTELKKKLPPRKERVFDPRRRRTEVSITSTVSPRKGRGNKTSIRKSRKTYRHRHLKQPQSTGFTIGAFPTRKTRRQEIMHHGDRRKRERHGEEEKGGKNRKKGKSLAKLLKKKTRAGRKKLGKGRKA